MTAWLGLAEADAAELFVRDAITGIALTGQITLLEIDGPIPASVAHINALLEDRQARSVTIGGSDKLVLVGPTAARVEASGYRPLHAVLRPSTENRSWTLMLDPIEPPVIPVAGQPDRLIISGWVSSAPHFMPVAGARINIADGMAETLSQDDGYFEVDIAAPMIVNGLPVPLQLRVTSDDHPEWHHPDLLLGPGGFSLPVTLGESSPVAGAHRQLRQDPARPEARPNPPVSLDTGGLAGNPPPASITVGFADASCSTRCCTGNCPHSCTFSLEEYTRRGLPKEWIASWAFDALAAGSVAYRSFGAWHAINPPQTAYDICSSACCQVNEPGTHSNTNLASEATSGLMLIRNGAVFRSEYSAQNNSLLGELSCSNSDLSCGNGAVGSPATGWPCLADPVGTDRACFGHGRGMSQWGNHFWTREVPPQNWKWQLNHYYNASGNGSNLRTATISQVLVIDAVRVLPDQAGPGNRVVLELDVRNLAPQSHDHVLIGASLRQPPGPFIDDPANDQPVNLPPGPSTISRNFDIPPVLSLGAYDVYTSLFIDVDQDYTISGNDLAQQLLILPDALFIDSHLFFDRFEDAGR